MRSQKILAVMVVLQVVTLLNMWVGSPVQHAQAQVADLGAQNLQIIDQLKAENDKLDKLISILESGNLQVHVAKPDDTQQKQ
jgi:cell division protein FtsB